MELEKKNLIETTALPPGLISNGEFTQLLEELKDIIKDIAVTGQHKGYGWLTIKYLIIFEIKRVLLESNS